MNQALLIRPQAEQLSAAPSLFVNSELSHSGFSTSDMDFLRQTGISPLGELSEFTSPAGPNLRLPTEAPAPVTGLNIDMDVVRAQAATPTIEIANKAELKQSIAFAVGTAMLDQQFRSIVEMLDLDADADEESDEKPRSRTRFTLAA